MAKLATEPALILAMNKLFINEKTTPLAKTHSLKEFFGLDGDVLIHGPMSRTPPLLSAIGNALVSCGRFWHKTSIG